MSREVSWGVAVSVLLLAAFLMALLMGCAGAPDRPPEQRTTTVQVPVPVPVPCFTEDERPVLQPPTPIDWQTATTEQLAAAQLADAENERNYAAAVDALFIRCLKPTQGAQP